MVQTRAQLQAQALARAYVDNDGDVLALTTLKGKLCVDVLL